MKPRILLYAVPILLIVAVMAWGQEQKQAPMKKPEAQQMMKQKKDWAAERTEKLTKALNLTADQQQKVKSIYQNEETQMEAAEQKYAGNKEEIKKNRKSIAEDTRTQINAVLTPDQQTKFAEWHKNWKKGEKEAKSMKSPKMKSTQKPDTSMAEPEME